MCIDLFCLIHPGKVNLEKELPFWMLPLLSPCVTSTLSLSPSELRTSLNPGHWHWLVLCPQGLYPCRTVRGQGVGKKPGMILVLTELRLLHAAEVQGWSRALLHADWGAGPITGAGFSFTLVPASGALNGCSDYVCAKGVLESSRKDGYFPCMRLFLLIITERCFKVLKWQQNTSCIDI